MIDRAELLEIAGIRIRVVTTADLIAMKERAAADPARRRSNALRDAALPPAGGEARSVRRSKRWPQSEPESPVCGSLATQQDPP
jgi:hypothetical protein